MKLKIYKIMKLYKLLFFLIIIIYCNTAGDAKKAGKIVNGERVRICRQSFRVSLQFSYHPHCSGNVLSENLILTTASCVLHEEGVLYGNIRILYGTADSGNESGVGRHHDVRYVIYHESYNSQNNWINDIAILVLASKINFIPTHSWAMIQVGDYSGSVGRDPLLIAGWETYTLNHRLRTSLRQIHIVVEPHDECLRYYENLDRNQVCAKSASINSYISKGDGGGGLVFFRNLYGMISAIPNNSPQIPFIIIKAGPYIDWIEDKMKSF